jgi:type IV secretory pathway VirB10-like protein
MPEPPPRVVEVHEPDVPPPISLPEEPVRNTPTRPRPTPATETARPAQPTPPPETPVDAVKPEELTPRPPTSLQTTPTQREEEVERRIRGLIGQAMFELNRINYQNLSSDGRTQYDTAKRFASQAEDALKAKNLPFANTMADKAATLATQLAGR